MEIQSASFPTHPCCQWAPEQSGHGGRNGGYMWDWQHGFPLSKTSLAMATVVVPSLPAAETKLSP